ILIYSRRILSSTSIKPTGSIPARPRPNNLGRLGKTKGWEVGTGYCLCRYMEPREADARGFFVSPDLIGRFGRFRPLRANEWRKIFIEYTRCASAPFLSVLSLWPISHLHARAL